MSFPTFIAIEAATQELDSPPLHIAWSLPTGDIKQARIAADESWTQEDQPLWEADAAEAYAPAEIVREFLYDQQDEVLYLTEMMPAEAWLSRLFDAAGQEMSFELQPAAELIGDASLWQQTYRETLDFLGLDPERAEDQVRALLEVHVLLSGEQPEISSESAADF